MKVSRNELVKIRVHLLEQMDIFLKNNVNEETVVNIWFTYGLEDGYDNDILLEYASDEELWDDCISAFRKCCIIEGILK